jgi:hypothetical protein
VRLVAGGWMLEVGSWKLEVGWSSAGTPFAVRHARSAICDLRFAICHLLIGHFPRPFRLPVAAAGGAVAGDDALVDDVA